MLIEGTGIPTLVDLLTCSRIVVVKFEFFKSRLVISKRYESIYLTGLPFCMYEDRKILFNCQRDYTPPAIKGLRKDK